MKAISLWQPWATLIMHRPIPGPKFIETRGWSTQYRGPLVIHAAKRRAHVDELSIAVRVALVRLGINDVRDLPYGAFLGECDLEDVKPSTEILNDIDYQDQLPFGNFDPGRFGFFLWNRKPYRASIPGRGMQKIFNWDKP